VNKVLARVDVILSGNTRTPCNDPKLIHYSSGGVALAIANKGFDVHFIDQIALREGVIPAVLEESPAQVSCYAVFFGNKANALRQMQEARRAPQAPRLIIAFGTFASSFPEEILSKGLADIVISGDPEFVIPAVLQAGEGPEPWSKIPNISFMNGKEIIHTPNQTFHDLDEIPFIGPYLYNRGLRPAVIMTARGCQYHCVFCDRNVLWGGGVRNRSVENVLMELRELIEGQHVRYIHFLDEDLPADHKRLARLCQGMRRIKGEFSWDCSSCVNSVNREMLLLMGHSGCRRVDFGVESASPEVLRRIGKTYGLQEILNAVRWSKEAGMAVAVMITIGNPGETDFDRNLTLSALNNLGGDVKIFTNRLAILPGTAFFRKGLREGWYSRESFFNDENIVFFDEKSGCKSATSV
jgi:anaerobic magnesium-protoporphyrin IX monomethyl ester cyclase